MKLEQGQVNTARSGMLILCPSWSPVIPSITTFQQVKVVVIGGAAGELGWSKAQISWLSWWITQQLCYTG